MILSLQTNQYLKELIQHSEENNQPLGIPKAMENVKSSNNI